MCFNLGVNRSREKKSREKKQGNHNEDSVSSLELSSVREINVRIVHAGGREELFQRAISASDILERHPGMVVAKPGIFNSKNPGDCVLADDDKLLPGQKYIIISSRAVEKIKQRHSRRIARRRAKRVNEKSCNEPSLSVEESTDVSVDESDEDSFCSAKDYYLSREEWPQFSLKRSRKKEKKFVPPIQMPRLWKEPGWEPSLKSIQEISP